MNAVPTTTESTNFEYSIHFYIISSCLFTTAFFGIIGNIHVIWAILKFPDLRTKNGVLLCFLACHHTVCLCFETLSGIRMRIGPSMTRRQCYSSIFVYTYTINHQCGLVLVLVCDIAFCMIRPLKYSQTRVYPYVHLMQIPCYVFGITFLIWGFLTINDEVIMACNPPLSYAFNVLNIWNICYLTANAATVIIYSSAIIYTMCCGGPLRQTGGKMSAASLAAQQRIVKSLSSLLIIFCFSWFLGAVAVRGPMVFKMDAEFVAFVQTYAVVPAVITYAQTYYVYYFSSRDYQEAFKKIGIFGFWIKRAGTMTTAVKNNNNTMTNNGSSSLRVSSRSIA